jgi:hypothetical protein
MMPMQNSNRERRWAWGIALLYGCFVVFIIGLIVFASSQDFPLVEQDYYQKELRYQQRIDQSAGSLALADRLTIELGENTPTLTLSFPREFDAARISGTITLYRPSDPDLDRLVQIDATQMNTQIIPIGDLRPGLWYVKVDWHHANDVYFDEQKIVIE